MLEKDIENLLARHPEAFFPGQGFKLVGQQVRLGRCRADLIFEDKHKRTIVVEIKRGLLGREAAGQIIEYYGLLKEQDPDQIVELILCANTIPPERKTFLERAGIECKELGVALIANLANQTGYRFLDEPTEIRIMQAQSEGISAFQGTNSSPGKTWIFQTNPARYDIINALANLPRIAWQVSRYGDEIKKGDTALIWMSGKESGIYALSRIITDPGMMYGPPEEDQYCHDEGLLSTVKRLQAFVEIKRNMSNCPLFRWEIKEIEGLQGLSILRQPQGTNFPVNEKEWTIIRKRINQPEPIRL